MNEFDLAGILKRTTSFETEFDDYEILAQDPQRLRYLISPKADEYFKLLIIKEINEKHKCLRRKHIDTNKVYLSVGGVQTSLFDVMYELRTQLNCTFELKFNSSQMEILLSIALPS